MSTGSVASLAFCTSLLAIGRGLACCQPLAPSLARIHTQTVQPLLNLFVSPEGFDALAPKIGYLSKTRHLSVKLGKKGLMTRIVCFLYYVMILRKGEPKHPEKASQRGLPVGAFEG